MLTRAYDLPSLYLRCLWEMVVGGGNYVSRAEAGLMFSAYLSYCYNKIGLYARAYSKTNQVSIEWCLMAYSEKTIPLSFPAETSLHQTKGCQWCNGMYFFDNAFIHLSRKRLGLSLALRGNEYIVRFPHRLRDIKFYLIQKYNIIWCFFFHLWIKLESIFDVRQLFHSCLSHSLYIVRN